MRRPKSLLPKLGRHLATLLALGSFAAIPAEAMSGKGRGRGKKPAIRKRSQAPAQASVPGPGAGLQGEESKAAAPAAHPPHSRQEARHSAQRADAPAHRIMGRKDLGPHRDLRGVFCAPGSDLSGLNLRGSDLSFAVLCGTLMTGTKLEGARLFGADVRGVVGLDLSGAEVHSFFETRPGEPVGAVTYYDTEGNGPAPERPCQMASAWNAATGGQHLFWLGQDGRSVYGLAPTGGLAQLHNPENLQYQGLAADAQDRLFLLGRPEAALLPVQDYFSRWTTLNLEHVTDAVKGRPLATAFNRNGALIVSTPGWAISLLPSAGSLLVAEAPLSALKASTLLDVLTPWPRGTPFCTTVSPLRDSVLVADLQRDIEHLVPLRPGGKARALAEAADGALWVVLPGLGQLARIRRGDVASPSTWPVDYFPLDPVAAGKRTPRALALGQDDNLWFTDPGAGCIGRIAPDGQIDEYPLAPGIQPMDIIASRDGRMFFTVAGKDLIGSIRVLPVPAEPEPEPAETKDEAPKGAGLGFEVERPARRPERIPGLSRRERWERHMRAEYASWEALAEAAEAGERKEAAADSAAKLSWSEVVRLNPVFEEVQEGLAQAPAPAEAPATAWSRLAALRAHLRPELAKLILSKHGWSQQPDKSQFSPAFSSAEGLAELLATGLAGVPIGQAVGRGDRSYTLIECKGAGRVGGHAGPETDLVKVITSGYWDSRSRTWIHDVINAYPVRSR